MESVDFLNKILQSFKIQATCVDCNQIDNYFYYDLQLSPAAKIRDLKKFIDEISLVLHSPCRPNIKTLYNKGLVRLEFIEAKRSNLMLFDLFTNKNIPNFDLPCLLGKTVDGQKTWMDLSKNPHMLIGGTTGSGKSVLLHNIIANLFNYNSVKLYLMDPKNIEFHKYDAKISNNLQVSYNYHDSLFMLDFLIDTMEFRYSLLRDGQLSSKFPYIVLIIDEFADLILQDVEDQFYAKLCRLAQKCRAAKMHIIIATQRPSVNIVNGDIKANFPVRISCRVASHVDSKVVLDATGAENLLGNGDAFLKDSSRALERFQIAYTSPDEVCNYFGHV